MFKTKTVEKGTSLALGGLISFSTMTGVCFANESYVNPDDVNLCETKQVSELKVGGGPSPSAAWTYKKSYRNTFSSSELDDLSKQYQGIINSKGYNRGQKAYNASLIALGYMGRKNSGANVANKLAWFGKTYHSEIQRSSNVLANAASKNKSVNLGVKEYVRPTSGQTMILFYEMRYFYENRKR